MKTVASFVRYIQPLNEAEVFTLQLRSHTQTHTIPTFASQRKPKRWFLLFSLSPSTLPSFHLPPQTIDRMPWAAAAMEDDDRRQQLQFELALMRRANRTTKATRRSSILSALSLTIRRAAARFRCRKVRPRMAMSAKCST